MNDERGVAQAQDGKRRTYTVEGTTLALESVDDVEGGHRLALRVLCVGDRVADDIWRGRGRKDKSAATLNGDMKELSTHSQGRA